MSQLTRKDPDAGKDWRQKEKGMTEDEMVGRPHRRAWVWAKLQEMVKDREAWRAAVPEVTESQTQRSYWTTTTVSTLDRHKVWMKLSKD